MGVSSSKMATPGHPKRFDFQHLLKNMWTRYIPMAGCVSTGVLSINILAPKYFQRMFFGCPYVPAITNSLWFNSHLGVGLYIYNRKHLTKASKPERVMFSVYGAVLFNFGTVLFWATSKRLLPKCSFVTALFGVGSTIVCYFIGHRYLNWVDRQVMHSDVEE